MSESIFLLDLNLSKNVVPVSHLFIEVFTKVLSDSLGPDGEEQITMEIVIAATLKKLGHTDLKKFNEDQVSVIANRLIAIQQKEAAIMADINADMAGEGVGPAVAKPYSFGSNYLAHFKELPTAEKMLVACGYDYEAARHLYCEVDKELADRVVVTYMESRWQELKTSLEASVLGFGGSFEDAKSTKEGFDMTTKEGQDAALSELKSMKF